MKYKCSHSSRICRDNNTDEQAASDDFVEGVNSGGAQQAGLTSATIVTGTTTGAQPEITTGEQVQGTSGSQEVNGASSIALSVLLIAIFTLL